MTQLPRHALHLPPRPPMPTQADQDRSDHQRARRQILDEDHDDVVHDWLKNYIREETLSSWGEPDISWNLLAEYARKMTTPGRYWKVPELGHAEDIGRLVEQLQDSGYWTKRQAGETRTEGVGDDILRLTLSGGRLVVRPVDPADVYVEVDPENPERDVIFWWLRARWLPDPAEQGRGSWIWAWDQYDVGGPGRPPSWRVVRAPGAFDGDRPPEDLSHLFLVRPDGSRGPMVGLEGPHRYPFLDRSRAPEFQPYLPFVRFRSVDSGRVWNHTENRGLHRGTLHMAAHATYADRAALDASGSFAIAWGLSVPASTDQAPGAPRESRFIQARPGQIVFAEPTGNSQPGVKIMGPAANLPAISDYMLKYAGGQLSRKGLGSAEAIRGSGAGRASGQSLYISDRERQEYQERTEPLARKADLEAVRKVALLLNEAHGWQLPVTGYSVTYPRRRREPQAEREAREEQQWEVDQGYRSRVDVYIARNPGASREAAIRALAQARADEALIAAEALKLGAAPEPTPDGPDQDLAEE